MRAAPWFLAVLTLLVGPVTGAGPASRRALVIGINDYGENLHGSASAGGDKRIFRNLTGAVNDSEAMKAVLVDRFGFDSSEIKLLQDREATRAAILAAIDGWLLDGTKAGDVRVFTFAGHGSQMRNSLSREADHLDETLVPADSHDGAPDIRDKELRRRFSAAASRGVILTIVLDSCHSGSAARGLLPGRVRRLELAPGDAADPTDVPDPVTRGALVLSAAQDFQLAHETTDEHGQDYGAFSLALARAMRSLPPDEGIEHVYRTARAILQMDGAIQDPVLGANEERKQLTLLGTAARHFAGAIAVAVCAVMGPEAIRLQAGSAEGLTVGTELVRAQPSSPHSAERLRITAVTGLSNAEALLARGQIGSVHAGDLFQIDRWVAPDEAALTVWVPPPLSPQEERIALQAISELAKDRRWRWIDDATETPATHVITWDGQTWHLEHEGRSVSLGAHLSTHSVQNALAGEITVRPTLAVILPAPASVTRRIDLGSQSHSPAIDVEHSRRRAQYYLGRRQQNGVTQVAWIRPSADSRDAARRTDLPIRTDWISADEAPSAAARLTALAQQLARVRGWLTLRSPGPNPTGGRVLILRSDGREAGEGQNVFGGDALRAIWRPGPTAKSAPRRFIYLFIIDSQGRSQLIFPQDGGVENRFPLQDTSSDVLLGGFSVAAPFGVDHYFVLTSDESLADPYVLEWNGVRTRSARAPGTPLESLLARSGSLSRGVGPAVPASWSLECTRVHSVSKWPN